MNETDGDRQAKARAILNRVESDSASFLTGVAGNAVREAGSGLKSHFAAGEVEPDDRATLWATRIGRALGVVAFVVLAINLFTRWFF